MMIKQTKQGFLILEMAIILCIIGIISTAYTKSLIIKKNIQINNTTKENIQTVQYAIIDFLARNYRLPSPSTNLESGIEGTNNSAGFIPYKTLGISLKNTKTGNGKPLFYIVENNLTNKDINRFQAEIENLPIISNNCFCKFYKPTIQIIESNNSSIDIDSKVAFAITDKKPIKNHDIYKIYDTTNTKWFTRGLLLSKYLKQPPCLSVKPKQDVRKNNQQNSFDDLL